MTDVYTYRSTVTRWVDGDTVDLDVDLGFHMWARTRFRLYGVDTPERGRPGYAEATAFAARLAPVGSPVTVRSEKDGDKFGRWLGVITTPAGFVVNDLLVEAGHAVRYYGGTR